jgi:hypothetical protein
MTALSNYSEDAVLNAFRNVSFGVAAVYVKLHTGTPGEDGTTNAATEATRKTVSFSAASGGSMSASTVPEWTSVAATETYSHVSLWDASTAGNCLWHGALSSSVAVNAGDTFRLTALTLTVD